MRRTITWLMVLVIASMLVGTAIAECAAMAMPCCSRHHTNCHEICAAPTGNVTSATVPPFAGELQAVATVSSIIPVVHLISTHIEPTLAVSAEKLLTRIHVLLI